MGRRVEVDEDAEPIAIPPEVLHELYAHARETLPEECCGLVLGGEGGRFGRAVRCRNDMNRKHSENPLAFPRDARTGFWMNEGDTQRAYEDAVSVGQQVTAVYHSHVDTDAYLSQLDLDYAEPGLFPDAAQIVIAVSQGQVKRAALFQRGSAGGAFRGHPVVSEAA